MSQLFVIVSKNVRNGNLYVHSDDAPEGYTELSTAQRRAEELQHEEGSGSGWEFVVGRVVEVTRE